jgi:hypothetical protein
MFDPRFALLLLSALALHMTACAPEYTTADEGDACGELDATCSTDETSVLVCGGNNTFQLEQRCAEGCRGATDAVVAVGSSQVNQVCCDNGAERECFNTSDQNDRDVFTYEE